MLSQLILFYLPRNNQGMELKQAPIYNASVEDMKNFHLLFCNMLRHGYHKVIQLFISFDQTEVHFVSLVLN